MHEGRSLLADAFSPRIGNMERNFHAFAIVVLQGSDKQDVRSTAFSSASVYNGNDKVFYIDTRK